MTVTINHFIRIFLVVAILGVIATSCENASGKRKFENFKYQDFKDSVRVADTVQQKSDTANLFDANEFIPGVDSLDTLLIQMDSLWTKELSFMREMDSVKKGIRKGIGYTPEEIAIIKENVGVVDSFLKARDTAAADITCRGKDCVLFLEVDKDRQKLFLYMLGEVKDSFNISSGQGKYETPNLDLRPSGPVFTKYTSRKFPGGNYEGLGNMPYAVFLRGGYAFHGTTRGNFPKLGTKASHGCIRLHPDDAKVLNALVKTVGLNQTWVTIRNSIPREAE